MKVFAEALKTNEVLTSFGLAAKAGSWDLQKSGYYHLVGDEGAQALADALRVNRSLRSINLEFQFIEGRGTEALLQVLQVNKSITCIHLASDRLEDFNNQAQARHFHFCCLRASSYDRRTEAHQKLNQSRNTQAFY